jgi:hypothetical protein
LHLPSFELAQAFLLLRPGQTILPVDPSTVPSTGVLSTSKICSSSSSLLHLDRSWPDPTAPFISRRDLYKHRLHFHFGRFHTCDQVRFNYLQHDQSFVCAYESHRCSHDANVEHMNKSTSLISDFGLLFQRLDGSLFDDFVCGKHSASLWISGYQGQGLGLTTAQKKRKNCSSQSSLLLEFRFVLGNCVSRLTDTSSRPKSPAYLRGEGPQARSGGSYELPGRGEPRRDGGKSSFFSPCTTMSRSLLRSFADSSIRIRLLSSRRAQSTRQSSCS